MNKALFYNAWSRTNSYFQNTEYAARNYPDAAELVLLAPMKKDLPPEVFTQIYQPPVSKGDGYDRDNLLKADKLLNEAGWVLKGQQRVNATTGQPLSFELLLPQAAIVSGYCRSSTACNGWVSTWTFAKWITRKSPTACAVATMT